ncbi:MAG: hypothetical protein AAFZ09_01460 [Pseudomonadota bacterium]
MSEAAEAPVVAGTAVPYLPRGVRLRHCPLRGAWFLLAPERALKLDTVGAHVLQALDGSDFDTVVAALAAGSTRRPSGSRRMPAPS